MKGKAAFPLPYWDNRFVVAPAKRTAPSIIRITSQGFVDDELKNSWPQLDEPAARGKCCPAVLEVPPTLGVPNTAAINASRVSALGVGSPIVSSISSQKLLVMSALPSFPPVPNRKPNRASTSRERHASYQSTAEGLQAFRIAATISGFSSARCFFERLVHPRFPRTSSVDLMACCAVENLLAGLNARSEASLSLAFWFPSS